MLSTSDASATNFTWKSGSIFGMDKWADSSNWISDDIFDIPGYPNGSNDPVTIDNASVTQPQLDANASAASLSMSNGTRLHLDANQLTVSGTTAVSSENTSLYVGSGTLDTDNLSVSGLVDLRGGTVQIDVGSSFSGSGRIEGYGTVEILGSSNTINRVFAEDGLLAFRRVAGSGLLTTQPDSNIIVDQNATLDFDMPVLLRGQVSLAPEGGGNGHLQFRSTTTWGDVDIVSNSGTAVNLVTASVGVTGTATITGGQFGWNFSSLRQFFTVDADASLTINVSEITGSNGIDDLPDNPYYGTLQILNTGTVNVSTAAGQWAGYQSQITLHGMPVEMPQAIIGGTASFVNGPQGEFDSVIQGNGQFLADVTNAVHGVIRPGMNSIAGNLVFGSNFTNQAGGILTFELGGTTPITEHDQINVLGDAMLDGTLDVSMLGGFALAPAQRFQIINVAGTSSGTFAGLAEGAEVGSFAEPLYITYLGGDGNDVVLSTGSNLPGDYNNDYYVDAADYTVWRDNVGAPAGTLVNDDDGGEIGAAQYETWVTNFGLAPTRTVEWDAGGDGTLASDPANWDPDERPTRNHDVLLPGSLGGPQMIDLGGGTQAVRRLESTSDASPNEYTLTNGTLEVYITGGNAMLTRDAGSPLNVEADVRFAPGSTAPRLNVDPSAPPITLSGSVAPADGRTDAVTLELTSRNTAPDASVTVSGMISDGAGGAVMNLTAGFEPDSENHRGTVRVTGANTFTGRTIVNGAVLEFNSISNVNTGGLEPANALGLPTTAQDAAIRLGAVDTTAGAEIPGTLRYIGSGHSSDRNFELQGAGGIIEADATATGGLALSGDATAITAGAKTFELGGDSSFANTFAGTISDGAGEVGFTKSGTSDWILSGASTYTGDTIITDGKLILENTSGSATGSGFIRVDGGRLAGGGSTTSAVVVSGAVEVGGGASDIADLELGNLEFNPGSQMLFDIAGTDAGTGYDQLIVAGQASVLPELVVNLLDDFIPDSADTFTLITAGDLNLEITNVADGGRLDTLGGEGSFLVNYSTAADMLVLSDFQLAPGSASFGELAVPEPATAWFLTIAAFGSLPLAGRYRTRRR